MLAPRLALEVFKGECRIDVTFSLTEGITGNADIRLVPPRVGKNLVGINPLELVLLVSFYLVFVIPVDVFAPLDGGLGWVLAA